VIHDGEIAALDEQGRSSFQHLQLFKSSGGVPLVYYVFDLLSLGGKDLRDKPLSTRRKLLDNLLKKPPENIRLSDSAAVKTICSESHKSLASRGWSPKSQIRSTKAAGAAVPGSNSRSPNLRSSLSAVTRCLREAGAILVLCWSVTRVRRGSCFAGRVGTGFSEKGFGKPLPQAPETETRVLPLYQLAGEIPRQMGPWDYAYGDGTLPVG